MDGGKDLRKRCVLSLEWKREGLIDSDRGGDDSVDPTKDMDVEQDPPGLDKLLRWPLNEKNTVTHKYTKYSIVQNIITYHKISLKTLQKCRKIDLVDWAFKTGDELKSTVSGRKFRAFTIRSLKKFASVRERWGFLNINNIASVGYIAGAPVHSSRGNSPRNLSFAPQKLWRETLIHELKTSAYNVLWPSKYSKMRFSGPGADPGGGWGQNPRSSSQTIPPH